MVAALHADPIHLAAQLFQLPLLEHVVITVKDGRSTNISLRCQSGTQALSGATAWTGLRVCAVSGITSVTS